MFSEFEYHFLDSHGHGRLSSIGRGEQPQVHPVSFAIASRFSSVEIYGPDLRETQKYRNVRRDPRVTLVVSDGESLPFGPDETRGRLIEIHGFAQLAEANWPTLRGYGTDIIRIRPVHVDSWNLDGSGHNSRFVD